MTQKPPSSICMTAKFYLHCRKIMLWMSAKPYSYDRQCAYASHTPPKRFRVQRYAEETKRQNFLVKISPTATKFRQCLQCNTNKLYTAVRQGTSVIPPRSASYFRQRLQAVNETKNMPFFRYIIICNF